MEKSSNVMGNDHMCYMNYFTICTMRMLSVTAPNAPAANVFGGVLGSFLQGQNIVKGGQATYSLFFVLLPLPLIIYNLHLSLPVLHHLSDKIC